MRYKLTSMRPNIWKLFVDEQKILKRINNVGSVSGNIARSRSATMRQARIIPYRHPLCKDVFRSTDSFGKMIQVQKVSRRDRKFAPDGWNACDRRRLDAHKNAITIRFTWLPLLFAPPSRNWKIHRARDLYRGGGVLLVQMKMHLAVQFDSNRYCTQSLSGS